MRNACLVALCALLPAAASAQSAGGLPALRDEVVAESAARQNGDAALLSALEGLQAQVAALEAKVAACVPTTCAWIETATYSLTSMPANAVVRQGAIGTADIATVYGRTAFYTTSDWGVLWIPMGLAGEPAFAVQADFYIPAATTFQRSAVIAAFTDLGSPPSQIAHGVQALFGAEPGGTNHFDWWLDTTVETPTLRLPLAASLADAWHTVRIEGVRSECKFRTLLDGVEVSRWNGACDASGSGIALDTWYQTPPGAYQPSETAWSNVRIFQGGTAACVP